MSCAESTLEIEVMWEYNRLTCVAAFRVVEWEVKTNFIKRFNFDGVTTGAATANPAGAFEFTSGFYWCSIFSFLRCFL